MDTITKDTNGWLEIDELVGKTLESVVIYDKGDEDEIHFTTKQGVKYKMYHSYTCCEIVSIRDVNGDIDDIIGEPILSAYESTNSEDTFGKIEFPCSFTWTFYRISTRKGTVVITWLGESNGCYSESVDFIKI